MKSDSSLLTGSVPKKLAAFALPLFLGNLLQALYNAVDMLVVGRIVGETGLAAISNASMLCYIINSLGLGLTMGGAVLAAQFKGAGDAQGQRDCVSMLLFASLSASVLVTFAGLAACEPVFRALYVPADAYDDIALDILFVGPLAHGARLPGLYLAQAISPVLPALVGTIYFKSRAWERKRPASPIDEYYDIY